MISIIRCRTPLFCFATLMIAACIDIGSTWTKGAAFQVDGSDVRILGRAARPTTVDNLADGFFAVLKEMVIGDLVILPDAFVAKKHGKELDLTHREFELLHHLANHLGQVMTRDHLLETVWGYDYFGDVRTVDVTIRRLREKIEDIPSRPEYILTRRGVGYYIKAND